MGWGRAGRFEQSGETSSKRGTEKGDGRSLQGVDRDSEQTSTDNKAARSRASSLRSGLHNTIEYIERHLISGWLNIYRS